VFAAAAKMSSAAAPNTSAAKLDEGRMAFVLKSRGGRHEQVRWVKWRINLFRGRVQAISSKSQTPSSKEARKVQAQKPAWYPVSVPPILLSE
jgi:hypothetical protein